MQTHIAIWIYVRHKIVRSPASLIVQAWVEFFSVSNFKLNNSVVVNTGNIWVWRDTLLNGLALVASSSEGVYAAGTMSLVAAIVSSYIVE